ncbi:MAG: hypothetical protein Q4D03_03240 [Bacteroidales bacterium]|nr:hypothetical protein [Bacteroidales bacterium]
MSQKTTMLRVNDPDGSYTIAYFFDADNKPCDKSDAVIVELCAFNKEGQMIKKTKMKKS